MPFPCACITYDHLCILLFVPYYSCCCTHTWDVTSCDEDEHEGYFFFNTNAMQRFLALSLPHLHVTRYQVDMKSDERKQLGRIMLKGDTITLMQSV